MPTRSPACCHHACVAAAALLLGSSPLAGCATTRPLDEATIAAEPVAARARAHVTLAAIGVAVPREGGRSSLGAVRPVTIDNLRRYATERSLGNQLPQAVWIATASTHTEQHPAGAVAAYFLWDG